MKYFAFKIGMVLALLTAVPDMREIAALSQAKLNSSSLSAAAKRNAVLRTELNWMLGGKQQRGWYLYTPLINSLLHTESGDTSAGFASALARWQTKAGIKPTGVLDEESFYAIISYWQGWRLQDRSVARPGQL